MKRKRYSIALDLLQTIVGVWFVGVGVISLFHSAGLLYLVAGLLLLRPAVNWLKA